MAGSLVIPNAFATAPGPIPLSQLDANNASVVSTVNAAATYSNYFIDSSGVANSVIVTVAAPTTFSYTAGVRVQVKLANTNTSATVTINVNGLGAMPVVAPTGIPLTPGVLASGNIIDIVFNATSNQFVILNQLPSLAGSFTGTLTGFSGPAPTGLVYYVQMGFLVFLYVPVAIGNTTSNANTMNMTGLPVSLTPTQRASGFCAVGDGTGIVTNLGNWTILGRTQTILFGLGLTTVGGTGTDVSFIQSGFATTGGTKGVLPGLLAAYSTI